LSVYEPVLDFKQSAAAVPPLVLKVAALAVSDVGPGTVEAVLVHREEEDVKVDEEESKMAAPTPLGLKADASHV